MAADAPADAAPAGRHQQFNQLHSLLSTAAEQGHGRSIYISGLPGTGKSHTVRAVLAALAAPPAAPAVRPPHPSRIPAASGPGPAAAPAAVFLSCFAIKDPKDIYSALLAAAQQQLGGASTSSAAAAAEGNSCPAAATPAMDPEHAYSALLDLLHKAAAGKAGQAAGSRPSKKGSVAKAAGSRRMCVFVLDEVDRLLQGRNGVEELYKLFMLPHAAAAREHGLSTEQYRAKYYWGPSALPSGPKTKVSNPFAAAAGASTGSQAPAAAAHCKPPAPAPMLRVPLAKAYDGYRLMCGQMYQQPASEQEFRTTLELLSHVGLVGLSTATAAQSAARPTSSGCSGSSAVRSGSGALGRCKNRGASAGASACSSTMLTLKASIRDIQAALKDNAVFRKVLAGLPAA
ncbi:AAA domain-containing protein [Haematococcus lacustris]|uniref:AAA domain-containing protein n=1 Tax=Haematococcus lacustris TaxID=44745 RepID=A0A699YJA6_HAELA|nr:AAA domain-containing protein [Haematococcus lacustris]